MSNNYNLAVDLTTVLAGIVSIDTVVDSIRAVDVPGLAAEHGTIDGKLLTEKEKIFMRKYGQNALNEYFSDIADGGVPGATNWSIITDDVATVSKVGLLPINYMRLHAGDANFEDAIMHGKDKRVWSSQGEGVTTLHFKTSIRVVDLTGQFSIGLINEANADFECRQLLETNANRMANIYCDNNVLYSHTGDGVAEAQLITGSFANNTWVLVEIILGAASTIFKINGAVVNTHTTHPAPQWAYCANFGSDFKTATRTDLQVEFNEVWPE